MHLLEEPPYATMPSLFCAIHVLYMGRVHVTYWCVSVQEAARLLCIEDEREEECPLICRHKEVSLPR